MSTLTALAFILLLWHSAFLRIKLVKQQKQILFLSESVVKLSEIVRDIELRKVGTILNELQETVKQ